MTAVVVWLWWTGRRGVGYGGGMKAMVHVWKRAGRWGVRGLAVLGGMAVLGGALQFSGIPWKAHAFLASDGGGKGSGADGWTPTHILVFGGSGIPGESGLMRLWYAAEAAKAHPAVPVWLALPRAECDRSDAAAAAYTEELRLRGVDSGRCEPRACGENTHAQAVGLVRAMKGAGPSRVLLVTSPEHVRRACMAVRRAAREAGADIEVRGLSAENLSLEDHGAEAEGAVSAENTGSGTDATGSGSSAPEVLRYEFWNHARYSLDACREGVALGYYWVKGWI